MRTRLSLCLCLVVLVGLAGAEAFAGLPGDVTQDGKVNVGDVQCTVLAALKVDPPTCLKGGSADINCDGKTNVGDVQFVVNLVLKSPVCGLPASKDLNGNCIVDACEGQCGNGKCDAGETTANCPADCPVVPVCGNGQCEVGETNANCPADCPVQAVCPNGVCEAGETSVNCPADCPVSGVNPGDVIITEFMKDPKNTDDSVGEWFEVRNMSTKAVDLKNWTIEDDGGQLHKITVSVNLLAGKMAVFGVNGNINTNGGVVVDYVYSNFSLGNTTGNIMLVATDNTIIDEIAYDATYLGCPGRAISLSPASMDFQANDLVANWCPASILLTSGDWGSPGVVNPNCPQKGVCGNNTKEAVWEDCDDGNVKSGDGCSDKCCDESVGPVCGNGKLEGMEQCDDGCDKGIPFVCEKGIDDGDGCSYLCMKGGAVCGDKVVEDPEECDDGNFINGDCCDLNCKAEFVCGDKVWDEKCEECDDGNLTPGDGCDEKCKKEPPPAKCGNGVKEGDEQCDDGCGAGVPGVCEKDIDDQDSCSWECKNIIPQGAKCGTGIKEPPDEECDDGCMYGVPNVCEDVDDATEPGDTCTKYCKIPICDCVTCEPNKCGNGKIEAEIGEECDDCKNVVDGDGCSSLCKSEVVVKTGFSGTATYLGQPAQADVLRVNFYSQSCPKWNECPGQPKGGAQVASPAKQQAYKVDTKIAGTYYAVCVMDIGGNNSQDVGPEDSGALANNGQPIVVQNNVITPNINCSIPLPGTVGTGFSGTVNYSGNPTTGCLKLSWYTEACANWKQCPSQPAGGKQYADKEAVGSFPFAYSADTTDGGTFWATCVFDVGCNSPQAPGTEDTGVVANNGASFNVQKDKVTPNINCTIPPAGQGGDTGCIAGTISWTGSPTSSDCLRLFPSLTNPPSGQPPTELKVQPVTFPKAYQMCSIPVGSYFIIGMFDKGCDAVGPPGQGDVNGMYKSMTTPTKVTVIKGQTISNISFELGK